MQSPGDDPARDQKETLDRFSEIAEIQPDLLDASPNPSSLKSCYRSQTGSTMSS